MGEPRHIIIHGHFYQPPRESPWTGLISPEHGAAPFQNWNERILSECYTANARAHTMEGPAVVHVRNNYESISFDVGPTLAGWLQTHGKTAYRAMTRGDALYAAAHGGHGNAIAQSYSHSILPLLPPRDRELQIAWGIDDFVFRFGRKPAGMWLPECAADDDTLASVAAAGIQFVILASDQGRFSGPGAESRGAGPFQWRSGDLSLAVFRFDRELSNSVSFGDGLADGARLADWMADTALNLAPGAALMIATDGETFGHHNKHGAAELARALIALERRDDVIVTNCDRIPGDASGGRHVRDYLGHFVELPAWGRAMARELRMPQRGGHLAGMAGAVSRRDGFREESCRGDLRSFCAGAGQGAGRDPARWCDPFAQRSESRCP